MLTEETLVQLPVGRQHIFPYKPDMRPSLKALPVTVFVILHNVSTMHLPLMVYLPKDDIAAAGSADEVVIIDTPQIICREVQSAGDIPLHPLPEVAVR